MKKKTCSKCREEKLLKEFHKKYKGKYGVRRTCKICDRQYGRDYYYKNREKEIAKAKRWQNKNRDRVNQSAKKYRENNPNKVREANKKWREKNPWITYTYGLNPEDCLDYCEVCKTKENICVDHCHDSGRVRGFLCKHCNFAAGLLKDDPSLAEGLARYLKNFKS